MKETEDKAGGELGEKKLEKVAGGQGIHYFYCAECGFKTFGTNIRKCPTCHKLLSAGVELPIP